MSNSAFTVQGTGTVTSVGISSDSLVVTNSPITTNGIIDLELPSSVNGANLLINGNMQVAQRGATNSVAASTTQYTLDRWQLSTNANQACTVTQNDLGVLSGQYYAVLQRNNGQTGTGTLRFCQSLPRNMCRGAAGNTVTLSFEAAAGANFSPTSGNITVTVYTGTGSTDISGINGAFTGSATVINQTQAISAGSFTTYTFTSSAIGSTVTQLAVQFSWDPTGTAGAADSWSVRNVKLEYGSKFTGFNNASFADTLQQCQTYYWKTFNYATAPAQNVGAGTGELVAIANKAGATLNIFTNYYFPVQMRASPTLTFYSPSAASAQAYDESAAQPCTGTTSLNSTQNQVAFYATLNAASAVGNLIGVHVTADAELV